MDNVVSVDDPALLAGLSVMDEIMVSVWRVAEAPAVIETEAVLSAAA